MHLKPHSILSGPEYFFVVDWPSHFVIFVNLVGMRQERSLGFKEPCGDLWKSHQQLVKGLKFNFTVLFNGTTMEFKADSI